MSRAGGRFRPLVAAPSAGGEADFDEEYPQLFLPALRVAYRLTGDRALAEDIAAEALARAFARWEKLSAVPYRMAWVVRVASNLALDAIRRRQPLADAQSQLRDQLSIGLMSAPGFDEMSSLRIALAAALNELPRRQRDVIVLRYLTDLNDEEISEALGVSTSTVRTHVQRGLEALRRRLDMDFEGRIVVPS